MLFGTVADTKDPDKLGRVQVKVAGFGPELTLPWLRVIQSMASKEFGAFFLPEKGDEVAILRGAGNSADGMVVLGCLYNGKNLPATPDADGENNVKEIKTRSGHLLTLMEKKGEESITIQTGDGKLSLIFTQKDGKVAIVGDKEITLTTAKGKMTVQAKEIAVTGDSNLTVIGKSALTIEGKAALTIKAKTDLVLSGNNVKITGKAGVEIG